MTKIEGQPARRSEKLQERRLKIVEAAATLFIEKGFHQASMRDIAGKAGISLGNLYNHFKGKGDIIAAIAELETADLDLLLQLLEKAEGTGPDVLLAFARQYYNLHKTPSYAALSAEITAEVFRNPQIGEGFLATRQHLISAVQRHLPPGLANTAITAGLFLDLVERAGQNAVGQPQKTQSAILGSLLDFLKRAVTLD
ncbi:MAG: TetR/AcrR family transcriptional regulator [Roseibium sp.]